MVFNDVVIPLSFPGRVCRRVCLRVSGGRIRRCLTPVSLSLDDACKSQRGDALVHDGLDYSVVAMVIDGSTGKVVKVPAGICGGGMFQ